MTVPVQSATPVLVGAANSAVIALPANATIGNRLILTVAWGDTPVAGTPETLGVPSDANGTWSVAINPVGYGNVAITLAGGAAIFHEVVASATTHSTTVVPPSGLPGNLYALVTLAEWPPCTLDQVQSNINSSAASTTAANSGTTATLASSTDFPVGTLILFCNAGLTNAGISTPATGYTASLGAAQNSATGAAGDTSYLVSAGTTTGQQTNWTYTSDPTMVGTMAVIATFTPTGGGSAPVDNDGDFFQFVQAA